MIPIYNSYPSPTPDGLNPFIGELIFTEDFERSLEIGLRDGIVRSALRFTFTYELKDGNVKILSAHYVGLEPDMRRDWNGTSM